MLWKSFQTLRKRITALMSLLETSDKQRSWCFSCVLGAVLSTKPDRAGMLRERL